MVKWGNTFSTPFTVANGVRPRALEAMLVKKVNNEKKLYFRMKSEPF